MKPINFTRTKWLIGLLTLALLAASPATSAAAGIAFINKTDSPIIIQGASYVNGMLQKSPQFVVFPNKTGYDYNLFPGFRQITIYDANRPNVVLLRKTVSFVGQDIQFFVRPSINPNAQYPIDLFAK